MTDLISILHYPFIQRALIAGILLSFITSFVGVFSSIRNTNFLGDAIAHSSLAGIAIGLMLNVNPIYTAFIYSIVVSYFLPWIKNQTKLSFENLLGILLPVSMGLGVIIFSILPGYQPSLLSFLFGNILTVNIQDIILLILLNLITIFFLIYSLQKITLVSLDNEYAKLLGINIKLIDGIYHFLLALIVVSGVKLVGVILLNALLIIPASIVKIHAKSLREFFILTPIVSLMIVIMGLIISALINAPSGATIAVTAGILFIISLII